MSLDDEIRAELRVLEDAHRLRVPRVVDGAQGPTITLDGAVVLNLSSLDPAAITKGVRKALGLDVEEPETVEAGAEDDDALLAALLLEEPDL